MRLAEPARAGLAFGERAIFRTDHLRAAFAQQADVGLGGGVQPHAMVHGRAHGERRGGGQTERGDQVVGVAVCQPRQQVRGRRRDHDAIGPAGQLDVTHGLFGRAVPQGRAGGLTRQGLEAQWGDELLGTGGHGDLDLGTGVAQASHKVQRLVGRDAATHAQQQLLAVQRARLRRGCLGGVSHLRNSCRSEAGSLPDAMWRP